jgi:hypothetical protein
VPFESGVPLGAGAVDTLLASPTPEGLAVLALPLVVTPNPLWPSGLLKPPPPVSGACVPAVAAEDWPAKVPIFCPPVSWDAAWFSPAEVPAEAAPAPNELATPALPGTTTLHPEGVGVIGTPALQQEASIPPIPAGQAPAPASTLETEGMFDELPQEKRQREAAPKKMTRFIFKNITNLLHNLSR